jgi:hypothetical protein
MQVSLAGVWCAVLGALLLLFLAQRLRLGYPRPRTPHQILSRGEAAFLDAAAATFFPAGGAMALSGLEADLPARTDRYLTSLPERQRGLIRALLLLFEHATLVFPASGFGGFRRFSSLAPAERLEVLESWAGSRLYLRRTGFTALKAVLLMAYFGHPECLRQLGLSPWEMPEALCEADLLYPPMIGEPPSRSGLAPADVTPPSDGTPLRARESRA